jgi:hypothetical protein
MMTIVHVRAMEDIAGVGDRWLGPGWLPRFGSEQMRPASSAGRKRSVSLQFSPAVDEPIQRVLCRRSAVLRPGAVDVAL